MRRLLLAISFFGLCSTASADEGMWTFDNFPSEAVAKKYNFKPDTAWLENVRLSSARLAGGCSASFVSASGLVMTNHHCAHSCIEQNSSKSKDLVKEGFLAKSQAEEKKCPEMEVNQLVDIHDVTERMNAATQDKDGKAFADAQKAETAKIRQECATDATIRCDVVTLYQGGQYALYKYKRYQDVRLVFAPEFSIAFFGGDPYNFTFPRYDLDLSFVRVYDNGKPLATKNFFPFSPAGAKEGELTFTSGHPGRTSREATIAELLYARDYAFPRQLAYSSELRGLLTEFQKRGPEQKRISNHSLFGTENGLKSMKGSREALVDAAFFQSKVDAENALRKKIAENKEWQKEYGDAWDLISNAIEKQKTFAVRYSFLEGRNGFSSELFGLARGLLRLADEKEKPNETRLREYVDANIPSMKQEFLSDAPIYDELEIARLGFSLTKLREYLGADDPIVKKVLGKKSPDALAAELIKGSKLKSIAYRKELFEGGKKAVDASKDPLIAMARLIDGESRALRERMENEISSAIDKGHEKIAKARFAIHGKSIYPDATFTLRLSYGSVEGIANGDAKQAPITSIGGVFGIETGEEPFDLPKSWLKAKNKLDGQTPFNFISSNDIVGGNSGSPVINQKAEIVGLIFDGNLPSLGGRYGFDPKNNRAVSVHSAAILEALEKVYGADHLISELRPKTKTAQSNE